MSTKQETQRAVEILAKSVYRDMKQNGYSRADMVAFASSILEQITTDAKSNAALAGLKLDRVSGVYQQRVETLY